MQYTGVLSVQLIEKTSEMMKEWKELGSLSSSLEGEHSGEPPKEEKSH